MKFFWLLVAVPHALSSFLGRAVGAAIENAARFYPVSDNSAATVVTGGSKAGKCTLKTVKCMCLSSHDDLKGFIVIVTA